MSTASESTPVSINRVHLSFDPTPPNEKGIIMMPDAEPQVVEVIRFEQISADPSLRKLLTTLPLTWIPPHVFSPLSQEPTLKTTLHFRRHSCPPLM